MEVRSMELYMVFLSSEILGCSGAPSNQLCTVWTTFSVPHVERA
jgi:hypothetical protein